MDTIDSVLMPYERKQRQDTNIIVTEDTRFLMERIPQIVDERGTVNPQFLNFYQDLCDAFTKSKDVEHVIGGLFSLFLSSSVFTSDDLETWIKSSKFFLKKFYYSDNDRFNDRSGLDIQIDVQSFSNQHRTMILNLDICTWLLDVESSDFNPKGVLRLVEEKSTLRFTYKNGKFKLIPYLEPFIQFDIE